MDGLMAQCAVAAIIHFVPQDVIFIGLALWVCHSTATAKVPKKTAGDQDAAVEAFKAAKGLDDSAVSVRKGRVDLK